MNTLTMDAERCQAISDRIDYSIELLERLQTVLDPEKVEAAKTVKDFLVPELGLVKSHILPVALAASHTDTPWVFIQDVVDSIDRANEDLLGLSQDVWVEDELVERNAMLTSTVETLRWSIRLLVVNSGVATLPRDPLIGDLRYPPGFATGEVSKLTPFVSFMIAVYLKDKILPIVEDNPDLAKDVTELASWWEVGNYHNRGIVIEGDLRDVVIQLFQIGYEPTTEDIRNLLATLRVTLEKWSSNPV